MDFHIKRDTTSYAPFMYSARVWITWKPRHAAAASIPARVSAQS